MPRDAPQTRDGQNVLLVRDRLRDEILRGSLPAGAVTSQTALSEELGVGRSVVREALRLLDMEGLVVGQPNKRVRIAELTGEDAEELYVVRLCLEVPAARLTVPRLRFEDIGELEGHLAQMDHYGRGSDWAGLTHPHRAFHAKFVSAPGERAAALILRHFDYAERYRLAYTAPSAEEWAERQAEHRGLIDAAAAGDAELTARRLAEHYARTAGRVCRHLDPEYELTRLSETLAALLPGVDVAAPQPA